MFSTYTNGGKYLFNGSKDNLTEIRFGLARALRNAFILVSILYILYQKERKKIKTIMIRVESETIEKLKEKYPELKNEKNATVVRVALSKLLGEKQ